MMLSFQLVTAFLACTTIVDAHHGESLENVQNEAKSRSVYMNRLKPRKRIGSCTMQKGSPSRQRINDRREEAVRILREQHHIDPSMPLSALDQTIGEAEEEGVVSGFQRFISSVKDGWNGPWRNDHKRDPSEVPISWDSLATGNSLKFDWGSYNLGNTLFLAPSVTEGPYFVSGENIRGDLRDREDGIPLYLDIQIVDINTCEPIPNAAVDLWQANATGVYGGINSFGNGLNDPRNIQNRALRGIQISDQQGSVRFHTIIPGHYWPRAPHIHVLTTLGAVPADSTIQGGRVAHVAQIFFDQRLNDAAFQVYPYSANNQIRLRNREDYLVMQGSAGGADPVAQYILLGKELKDGVFAWINFAIDPTEERRVTPLVQCEKDGCKQQEQWWFQKLALRIITFPNVYFRKPPIIESTLQDERDSQGEAGMSTPEGLAMKEDL